MPANGLIKNVKYFRREHDNFVVSTDPELQDLNTVMRFLTQAKWWNGLNYELLERAFKNSLCFSLLEGSKQIGIARVITDYVTYAYLCDVFIEEDHRGQGLGSWLIRCILEHPELSHLKRIALITHDAQQFYFRLDFQHTVHPEFYMERLR